MKKLLISILLPAMLLAYQPPSPPPVTLQPQPVFWPLVIGGAVVVGGAGFLGIKIVNGMLRAWEHRITNNVPEGVQFTLEPEEESGQ